MFNLSDDVLPYLAVPEASIRQYYQKNHFLPSPNIKAESNTIINEPKAYPIYRVPLSTKQLKTFHLIKVCDQIKKYQTLSQTDQQLTYAHSPVSGIIQSIEETPEGWVATIENDFLDNEIPLDKNLSTYSPIELLQKSGLYGLGGGGFSSALKMEQAIQKNINTLLINLVECEKFTQTDHALFMHYPEKFILALTYIQSFYNFTKIIIAFKQTNSLWSKLKKDYLSKLPFPIQILPIPDVISSGYEKFLIELLLQKKITNFRHAIDSNILSFNFSTIWHIGDILNSNKPYIGRFLTIGTTSNYQNIFAHTGTLIRDLVDSYFNSKSDILYYQHNANSTNPISSISEDFCHKTTRSLLLYPKKTQFSQASPCIHCNQCDQHCPENISPQQLLTNSEKQQSDNQISQCTLCGICEQVCPAKIPLNAVFQELRDNSINQKNYDKTKEIAKMRVQAKANRVNSKTQEILENKAERLKNKKNLLSQLHDQLEKH